MDIVDGKCVFCTENNVVLSDNDKRIFFDLVKSVFFTDSKLSYSKFVEVNESKSVCICCAYKLDIVYNVKDNYKTITAKTKKLLKNACSVCFKNDNVHILASASEHFSYISTDFLNIVNENTNIKDICIHCCYSLFSWDKFRSSLNCMDIGETPDSQSDSSENLNEMAKTRAKKTKRMSESSESNSTVVSSENENKRLQRAISVCEDPPKSTNLNRRTRTTNKDVQPVPSTTSKSLRLRGRLLRRKSADKNEISEEPAEQFEKNKKRKPTAADDYITKKLSHLKSVHKETNTRNMHLSYDVLMDKVMMFGIPYVLLGDKELKAEKNNTVDEVILVSSDDESVIQQPRNTRTRSKRKAPPPHKIAPAKKIPKVTKKQAKQSSTITYPCSECDEIFTSKTDFKLHTLEHESSFSPVVRLEICNLDEVKVREEKLDTITSDAEVQDEETFKDLDDATTDSESLKTGSSDDELNTNQVKADVETENGKAKSSKDNDLNKDVNLNSSEKDEEETRDSLKTKEIQDQDENVPVTLEQSEKEVKKAVNIDNTNNEVSADVIDRVINKYININESEKQEEENKDNKSENQTNNNEKKPRYRPGPKSKLAKRKIKDKQKTSRNNNEKHENQTLNDSVSSEENKITGPVEQVNEETDKNKSHNENEPSEEKINSEKVIDNQKQAKEGDCKVSSENAEKVLDGSVKDGDEKVLDEQRNGANSLKPAKEATKHSKIPADDVAEIGAENCEDTNNDGTDKGVQENSTDNNIICNGDNTKTDHGNDESHDNKIEEVESDQLNNDKLKEKSIYENKEEITSTADISDDDLESDSNNDTCNKSGDKVDEEDEKIDDNQAENSDVENNTKDNTQSMNQDSSSNSSDVQEVDTDKIQLTQNDPKTPGNTLDDVEGDEAIVNINLDDIQQDIIVGDSPEKSVDVEVIINSGESPTRDSDIESLAVSSQDSDENEKDEKKNDVEQETANSDTSSDSTNQINHNFKTVENLLENLGA